MLPFRRLRHATAAVRRFSAEASSSTETIIAPSSEPTTVDPGRRGGDGARKAVGDNLGRRLLNLVFPKRSAVVAIRKWIEEGHRVQKYQLIHVVRHLRKQSRYKHALEICEWMTLQKDFQLLPGDYAVHLDLVAKVRGLASAEKFFEDLPEQMKKQSTWTSLLHVYVQNNVLSKAESLMEAMSARGFLTCCLPYNHMVNLYITNGQLDKVPKVIQELKQNVLPDAITYNLWLTACADNNDVKAAENAFLDMQQRKIAPDWMTYSILAKVYIKASMPLQARKALKEMEKIVSKEERKAYCSLITLHANLSDKDSVNRIWKELKSMFRKMSDVEYSCVLASLVRLGDIEEAESIYSEWESTSGTRDTKTSNILLSAYTRNGMMEKARSFLENTVQKGTKPNYITWELLAWGFLWKDKIADVLDCLENAFAALKKWEPDEKIVEAVFDKLEKLGDIEHAEKFLIMLRKAGYVTTQIYNSLLRTYEKAGKMPLIVVERMEKDKVQPDDETRKLILSTSRFCISNSSSFLL